MARLMFSAGMFAAFASAMIVRSRGFMSGSPPPPRAATVSSLMIRVKILPRLASSAPFLCLIDAHFEWPDMGKTPVKAGQILLHRDWVIGEWAIGLAIRFSIDSALLGRCDRGNSYHLITYRPITI